MGPPAGSGPWPAVRGQREGRAGRGESLRRSWFRPAGWIDILGSRRSCGRRLSSRAGEDPGGGIAGDAGPRGRAAARPGSVVTSMPEETGENDELLRLAAGGDGGSWQALVDRSQSRLRRMVAFRLDQRLRGRVDPSDVLQDAYLEA